MPAYLEFQVSLLGGWGEFEVKANSVWRELELGLSLAKIEPTNLLGSMTYCNLQSTLSSDQNETIVR